jgi:hypothetical protein
MHDDWKVFEQDITADDSLDAAAPEAGIEVVPQYTHSLMDILLPAKPPRPVNARVIRRLKD